MVISKEYDARHEKCPLPLIKTKLLLKQLEDGQLMRVLIGDSGSYTDIPKFLSSKNIQFKLGVLKDDSTEIIITKSEL